MLKIIKSFLIFTVLTIGSIQGQDINEDLRIADSLFQQKKYTESFKIYDAILSTGTMASNRMLLKMAYIKEGLGEDNDALYYLNLYYLSSQDETVLPKMEEMAIKNGLEGYSYDDTNALDSLYRKHYLDMASVLAGLALVLFILVIVFRIKGKNPTSPALFLSFLLIGFFLLVNWGSPQDRAIINDQRAYIMKGPSPGSGIVEVVKKGHRVDVLDKNDVWTTILWEGQRAYILENSLQPLDI